VAKKSLVVKQQRKPKYEVRAYSRCSKCGRRAQIETSTVDDMPTPKQAVAVAERIIADHQHGVR